MIRKFLLLLGLLPALLCARVAMAQGLDPDVSLKWQVVDRFRLLRNAIDQKEYFSYIDRIAKQSGTSGAYDSPIPWTVARNSRGKILIDRTRWVAKSNQYDVDYVFPKQWTISVQLDGLARASDYDCTWSVATFPMRTSNCARGFEADMRRDAVVQVDVTKRQEARRVGSRTVTVRPRDILIAVIGDSFFSGEGAPDLHLRPKDGRAAQTPARWWDERCHRSLFSGPAIAAALLARDPAFAQKSVTFVSFACSGAAINDGILTGYVGRALPDQIVKLNLGLAITYQASTENLTGFIPAQIDALALSLCSTRKFENGACTGSSRQPDVLLVSTGGNEVGFGPIARNILANDSSTSIEAIKSYHRKAIACLADGYDQLAKEISARIKPKLIGLVEYPNLLTWGKSRQLCDEGSWIKLRSYQPSIFGVLSVLGVGTSKQEAQAALDNVLIPLDDEVAKAVSRHKDDGWLLISGIRDGALGHGFCSAVDPWFNNVELTLLRQGMTPSGKVTAEGLPPASTATAALDSCLSGALSRAVPPLLRTPFVQVGPSTEIGALPTGVLHPNARGTVVLYGPAILDAIREGLSNLPE
ncbi:hypothetical protein [Dongia sedimenti]|uniref:SGNH hydrolase-type esterase domain-containing protein n=1 Tax=Dongia sedimenti TaxID=3064282 RepID=A0ABU0YL16_9PROT|nr:hypothetical protein [Rhodospirillaceae bacterium R-7]